MHHSEGVLNQGDSFPRQKKGLDGDGIVKQGGVTRRRVHGQEQRLVPGKVT